MSRNFQREAIDGGDTGVWANPELTQNRLSLGILTIRCYDDSGTLKATIGKAGLQDNSINGICHNTAIETISIAGVTNGNWFKIEIQRNGSSFDFLASDTNTAVDTDVNIFPSTITDAYDPEKGGIYDDSNYRVIAIGFKTGGGALDFVINCRPIVAEWFEKNYDRVYEPTVADGGGAYQDGYVQAWSEEKEDGLTRFYGWGWIEVDNTNDAVKMDITMPITFSNIRRILGETNGRTTAGEGAPSSLLDTDLNVTTRGNINVGFDGGAATLSVRIVKDDGVFFGGDFYAFSFDILGIV